MRIMICGTPGVGKTTLSCKISSTHKTNHIDISKYIISHKIYDTYNKKHDTYDFNIKNLNKHLAQNPELSSEKSYIIDTHTPQVGVNLNLDLVFVLRTPLKALSERLKQRGYNEQKVRDNLDCEIFNEAGFECEELFGEKVVYVGSEDLAMKTDDVYENIIETLNRRKIKF